jgi:hypothetical protein
MATPNGQVLPQKEAAVFKTIVVSKFWDRSAHDGSLCAGSGNYSFVLLLGNGLNDGLTLTSVGVEQKFYETKQYKKGLKSADSVLKKFPDHGEFLREIFVHGRA